MGRIEEARDILGEIKKDVPDWNFDVYRKGNLLFWGGNQEVHHALTEGIEKLGVD